MSFPDFVGMISNGNSSEVSRIVSPKFDGRLNADASGINSTEVAFSSAALRTTVVSLKGLSANVGAVPQEKKENKGEKINNFSGVIELRLTLKHWLCGGILCFRPPEPMLGK